MKPSMSPGFSLIEMMITVLVFGVLLGFAVPGLTKLANTDKLKGATENIAAELRLARQKAIATGVSQTMHFTTNYPPGTTYDYHIHNGAVVGPCWSLPNGITYARVTVSPTLTTDGRVSASGIVVLRNQQGDCDTINVERSGLILVQ